MHRSLLAALLTLPLLAACDDSAHLASGTWNLVEADMGEGEVVAGTGSLVLDLDGEQVSFLDADGAELAAGGIALWPRADWPSGCPTNFSATRMETADVLLDQVELPLDDGTTVTIVDPVLVASCPDGEPLYLRSAFSEADLDSGTTGCSGADACLVYEPAP